MVTFGLVACSDHPTVVRSMYNWRNVDHPGIAEEGFLDSHRVQLVFWKVLDIDWNEANEAHPISINEFPELPSHTYEVDSARLARLARIELVPVVYITNRTMQRCDGRQLEELVSKLARKLEQLCGSRWNEVQLDCDWSASSMTNFFTLIEKLRERTQRRISATIRLHQYRDPGSTGVPPVDRGMLMMYNVDDIKDLSTTNSIFNPEAARPYFDGASVYPLPLDIALPSFSWALHFRSGLFQGIMDMGRLQDLIEYNYCMRDSTGRYSLLKEDEDHWITDGLRIGDQFRVEAVDSTLLQEAIDLSRQAVNDDTVRIAFFHLQERMDTGFTFHTFEHAWSAYR